MFKMTVDAVLFVSYILFYFNS